MPENFTLRITTPEGAHLWTGSLEHFTTTNEGRDSLIEATSKLAPGESLDVLGQFWFGDSEDGISPLQSTITRVVEEPRASISSVLMRLAVLVTALASVQACIPCGGADDCCDTNGTVMPPGRPDLCR